jgi:autotransporter-associated beta strand protein
MGAELMGASVRFGRGQRWMQGAASAALAIGVSISMATWAEAACTPNAVDSTTPAPGTTVTCDLTTIEQNAPHGYGTGNQMGITINVLDNASVQGSTLGVSHGIWVGDAVIRNGLGALIVGKTNGITAATGPLTVTNNGTITGTNGIGVSASGNITLANQAGGAIFGGANGIVSTAGAVTVENAGSISATTTSAIQGFTDVTVTNRLGGVISGGIRGIQGGSGLLTLDNAGSITSSNPAASVFADNSLKLTNRAGASISGAVGALNSSDIYNAGSLGGINGPNSRVVNTETGTIGAISSGGPSDISNFGVIAGGVLAGGNLVNQAGGRIGGFVTATDLSIINSGTIDGGVGSGPGFGMQLVNSVGATINTGVSASGTSASIFNAGTINGTGAPGFPVTAMYLLAGTNTLTLAPTSVINGQVYAFAGTNTFQLGGTGTGSFDISQLGSDVTQQYFGFTTFNKVDSSLWSLTGTSTYTGPLNVNGGTLAVNGNLATASLLTVNPDGTLGGTGTLGATIINGGMLAPGNSIGTLTMSSLTMTAASTYLVEVSGTSSDMTVVTGAAVIAGKAVVNPLKPLTSTTTYTILNAGTLSGTFDSASIANNFARNARLSYVGNDVLLTLDPGLLSPLLPGNASINNRNVAAGIDNALVVGANMPASFNGLFLLTGNNLLNALTQISGETSTGAQQTTFDAMTQFMGVLSDPFTVGRGGTAPAAFAFADENGPLAYAPDGRKRSRTERDAFSLFTKAPPRIFEARWNVWAAGFGGSRTTDGNTALGSNRTTGNIGAATVGADYWFSPDTVAGFALAGGGTSFSVANGGSGQSDLFQAGAFVRHNIASSYITATAAYGWQDIRTDRLITAVGTERLRADFNANAFSGRIEGGHRWLVPELGGIGLTPYSAAQVTAFDLPSYAETSANGAGGFALNYAAKTVTSTRAELGLRGDKSWGMAEGLLTLRGRAAWAHDFNSDRSVSAVFQSLPGSAFIVNGARAAHNAALASASAEMSFNGGWSVAATLDGEFSDVSRSYAGKGVVRYAW